MEINIPLFHGISLKIGEPLSDRMDYPTVRLQRGFLLLDQGQDLAEEAVGFGVPVLKRGMQTIFPGDVALSWLQKGSTWEVTAQFKLNLLEKISRGGNETVGNKPFYAAKNFLSAIIRRFPFLRSQLTTLSNMLRQVFNWKTTYADGGISAGVQVNYIIEEKTGKTMVDVDVSHLPADITEVVVMNEQGAHAFDRYLDSSGNTLQGDEIGCWDEVNADEAGFESSSRQVAFRLGRVKGARLFRGRELIGSRLAWAGFGYSFPPSIQRLRYEMKIERVA
ncbi:MAG TPA: hypothetical protein VF359_01215 [Anaerolineales bacterium]